MQVSEARPKSPVGNPTCHTEFVLQKNTFKNISFQIGVLCCPQQHPITALQIHFFLFWHLITQFTYYL